MAQQQFQTKVLERIDLKEPHKWAVIFWNDDFTTMEFVVQVLTEIFLKSGQDAEQFMMKVHKEGQAVVGTYSYDIAASRKNAADKLAKMNNFPLKITIKEV